MKAEVSEKVPSIAGDNILDNFIGQLNQVVKTKELSLQVEESSVLIAKLQGYIAGARKYKVLLKEAGFESASTELTGDLFFETDVKGHEECNLLPIQLEIVTPLMHDVIRSEKFKDFEEKREEAIENAKSSLFFQSEKGRDLYFYRGWYEAIMQIDHWVEKLDEYFYYQQEKKAKAEREAREELQF